MGSGKVRQINGKTAGPRNESALVYVGKEGFGLMQRHA